MFSLSNLKPPHSGSFQNPPPPRRGLQFHPFIWRSIPTIIRPHSSRAHWEIATCGVKCIFHLFSCWLYRRGWAETMTDIFSIWILSVSYRNQKQTLTVAMSNKGNDGKGQCSSCEEQHPPPRQTFNTAPRAAVAADARAFVPLLQDETVTPALPLPHRATRFWATNRKTKVNNSL